MRARQARLGLASDDASVEVDQAALVRGSEHPPDTPPPVLAMKVPDEAPVADLDQSPYDRSSPL